VKKKDPLDAAIERMEMQKAEELLAKCKHPNVRFQQYGFRIRCVDCPRYWIAGLKVKNLETNVADAGYANFYMMENEFRHSPNEVPRIAPVQKKPAPKKR
jgi:hypothetical protein